MKITYIYHSSFAVELEDCVLLFDYYKGRLPEWEKEKKIYVFASHQHADHFSLKIFELMDRYQSLHYFLGNDIKLSEKYLERNHISSAVKEKITSMGKNKKLVFDDIKIETLRSTDEGVAFIVEAGGQRIYHGGDLNWWHWEGEPYPYNEAMERDYKQEIGRIEGMHFDVAFVPLDPRLGRAFGWGMDYFLGHTDTSLIFPMHMWDEYEVIEEYKKSSVGSRYRDRIMSVRQPGQEF